MERFEKAVQRIKNIDWSVRKQDLPSHALLVTEFINRGNVFRDVYCPENKMRKPIYSAAQIIGVEEKILLDIQKKVEELDLLKQGWTVEFLCKYFLEWEWAISVGEKIDVRFEDLYEPIILLFERGGRVSYHHNELVCGKYGWPQNVYPFPRTEFNELNMERLDEIDGVE
ncbi:hypothetical protein SAMN04487969_104107 [Paenibacillus algorifonticola]|uniref:Uncharacterized protein n=1 Tax=Paenibacillus algorifonticola TaxID=684063 RepID=A0A1I2BVN6_9BACL|nr:hypothetical protein [Paenibacillus algorifonticola]SFE60127.1 hypothetical protein SAMN04487969_104107 [Paenibacillus algorifonticola]